MGRQSLPPDAQALIRERVLLGARDPSQAVRHTAGTLVTTIVSATRLASWPELLPALVAMLESGDAGLGDGALNALLKVWHLPRLNSGGGGDSDGVEGGGRSYNRVKRLCSCPVTLAGTPLATAFTRGPTP